MVLAANFGDENLKAQSGSLLITKQVIGAFSAKDVMLIKYFEKVQQLKLKFISFELAHVPREQNSMTDILAKLARTKKLENNHTVIQETISQPRINEVYILSVKT